MEGTLEELRRISNCPEGATFSQLGLRKSVATLPGVTPEWIAMRLAALPGGRSGFSEAGPEPPAQEWVCSLSTPTADDVAAARQRRFLDADPNSFATNAVVETNASGEQMATLDEIGQERQRISERLAQLDAERTKLSEQLNDLVTAERVMTRFGGKADSTPGPKTGHAAGTTPATPGKPRPASAQRVTERCQSEGRAGPS